MGNVGYVRRGLITGVLGRILLGIGVLVLLFVAYQLWGTGIVESHSQAVLRQRFDAQLHHVVGKHPSSSTTTTSGSGDQPTVGGSITAPNDGSPVGVLHIAKIGLDKVIVEGTTTDDLRQGQGHYTGTPLPGRALRECRRSRRRTGRSRRQFLILPRRRAHDTAPLLSRDVLLLLARSASGFQFV